MKSFLSNPSFPKPSKLLLASVFAFSFLFLKTEYAFATWLSPTGSNDPSNAYTYEQQAYDGGTGSYAYTLSSYQNAWTPFLELTHPIVHSDKIRFRQAVGSPTYTSIDIDVYYSGGWHDVYQGSYAAGIWLIKNIPEGAQDVSKERVRLYVGSTSFAGRIYEVAVWDTDTSGNWVSPTGYIDGPPDTWCNEEKIYDDQPDGTPYTTSGYSSIPAGRFWGDWIILTLGSPVNADRVRFYTEWSAETGEPEQVLSGVEIEVYNNSSGLWESVYAGEFGSYLWIGKFFPGGTITTSQLRMKFGKLGTYGGSNWVCPDSGVPLGEVDFGQSTAFVPSVQTNDASIIRETTATLNGEIINTGGANVDQRGFDWGLTTSYGSSWTETGSYGTGSFSRGVTGLSPGTLYYFRAKAHNSVGWGYGEPKTFTTVSLPCLERAPSSLTFSATVGGSNPSPKTIDITNSGGGTLSWTSSDDQTWMTATGASPGSTVSVSINISGLSAGTYTGTVTMSCNPSSSCQATGTCQQKTTSVTLTVNPALQLPTVQTNDATSVSQTSATLNGNITNTGGVNADQRGFDWGLTAGYGSSWTETGSYGTGSFSRGITGLSPGTLYHFRAKAHNSVGWGYGADRTFTTISLPCLERSPDTLTFSATVGGNNPSPKTIDITNSGGGTLSWTSSDDQTWMTATGASPGSTATVSINISGLAASTYTGTVTLSCTGSCQSGSCSQKTTSVTLTVNPAPVPAIGFSPSSLTFTSICEGATSTESRTFEVWNSGGGGSTLNWSLSESASWFGVSPASGSSTGEHDVVTVTLVNTSSLSAGTYTSNITVADPNASNSPQTVPVGLTVNTKACLERSPSTLTFSATAGGSNPSSQNINISNSGTCSLSWASSDDRNSPNWLLTTDAGSTATVSINISGLAASTYTGTVTLSCTGSCQSGSCSQKTTSVTLTVNDAIGTISGCVWRDTNSVCPADGTPDINRPNAVEISATGYSPQTAGTGATGCYTFNSVPYNPSGTVYRVEVKKPVGEETQWSYACAGGFSGQDFKDVTLATGTSSWTVNFSIINIVPGWFQVIDGDIHSEGEIRDEVP